MDATVYFGQKQIIKSLDISLGHMGPSKLGRYSGTKMEAQSATKKYATKMKSTRPSPDIKFQRPSFSPEILTESERDRERERE